MALASVQRATLQHGRPCAPSQYVGRAHLGVGSTGAAKYSLQLALQYASERKQFGSTLDQFGLIRAKMGEMACRIYAAESAGFRTAGLIDAKYHSLDDVSPGVDDDDYQRAVEEFTIEASIIKVYGSEVLDYTSDEALQIHGGYGYIAEYHVERVARDARINRIFEGTNKINRLLLAGTLLKRGLKGRVPLMKRFGAISKALKSGEAPAFEPKGTHLADTQRQVERIKTAALFSLHHAVTRYMMTIEKQQEVLGAAADMLIDAFVADSAVTRAVQYGEGKRHSQLFTDCATVTVEQARDRVFSKARSILCAVLKDDKLVAGLEHLAVVDHWSSCDLFQVRERVAATMIELGSWPRS